MAALYCKGGSALGVFVDIAGQRFGRLIAIERVNDAMQRGMSPMEAIEYATR